MKNLNIRKIDPKRPGEKLIKMTAEILEKGGIIAAPTETQYGLLGRIDRTETVNRLYEMKKRPETMATAIFVRSKENIKNFGMETEISKKLAEDFLPGPMTLVLENKSNFAPPIVVNNKIGIRCSSSPFIENLLSSIDFNLTATSANISGGSELNSADEIAHTFGDDVDLYLDAGCLDSLPSTVVECIGDSFSILRHGIISKERINKSLAGI